MVLDVKRRDHEMISIKILETFITWIVTGTVQNKWINNSWKVPIVKIIRRVVRRVENRQRRRMKKNEAPRSIVKFCVNLNKLLKINLIIIEREIEIKKV